MLSGTAADTLSSLFGAATSHTLQSSPLVTDNTTTMTTTAVATVDTTRCKHNAGCLAELWWCSARQRWQW
jgi:hypothetical protein